MSSFISAGCTTWLRANGLASSGLRSPRELQILPAQRSNDALASTTHLFVAEASSVRRWFWWTKRQFVQRALACTAPSKVTRHTTSSAKPRWSPQFRLVPWTEAAASCAAICQIGFFAAGVRQFRQASA